MFMPKKLIHLSILTCLLALLTLSTGCGSSSSSSSSISYTSRSISMSLSSASTSSLSTSSLQTQALSDYSWVLQNKGSLRVYFGDFASDGSTSGTIETASNSGYNNFSGAILDADLNVVAPIVFSTSGGIQTTGADLNGDISNLTLTLNTSTHTATATGSIDTDLSSDSTSYTRVDSSSIPVSYGNAGKGSAARTSSPGSSSLLDSDHDGLINIFDTDNDGNGKVDNADATAGAENTGFSSTIASAILFDNLKIDYTNSANYTVTNDTVLTVEFTPYDASKISSIIIYRRNSHYNDCTTTINATGFTALETYPAIGTTWTSTGYKLYKMTNLSGSTVWTVFLTPNNNSFTAGDKMLAKVTLTSGGVEYYWLNLNFKYQTIVADTTTWNHGGAGSQSNPYLILDTGGRVFSWTAPKDETGADLTGVVYSLELFYYNSAGTQVGSRQTVAVGTDIYTSSIPEATIDLFNSSSAKYIQCDLTASYPYGDNSANKIYFKRSSW